MVSGGVADAITVKLPGAYYKNLLPSLCGDFDGVLASDVEQAVNSSYRNDHDFVEVVPGQVAPPWKTNGACGSALHCLDEDPRWRVADADNMFPAAYR